MGFFVLISIVLLSTLGVSTAKVVYPRFFNDHKIIGGNETTIEKYPYHVALFIQLNEHNLYLCGGSILSEEWILTAAHCIDKCSSDIISVRAGTTIFDEGEKIQASSILMHPDYNNPEYANDVGLIKLNKKLNLDGLTKRAIKLSDEEPAESTLVTVTGWGVTESGGSSAVLREVQVPIVKREKCIEAYKKEGITIDNSEICAGFDEGGKDSCQGDSGGALAIGNVQYGIVSFGYNCAVPGYPGVYTNIADLKMRNWIKQNTGL